MDDTAKTKAQLIRELTELRQRVAAQETSSSAFTQAQSALNESETRFRQLVEGSIQGILILRDSKPLFVNLAYAEIFGYETPDELLQIENIAEQVAAPHEYDRLQHYARLRIRGEEPPTHYVYQGVRKDGGSLVLSG